MKYYKVHPTVLKNVLKLSGRLDFVIKNWVKTELKGAIYNVLSKWWARTLGKCNVVRVKVCWEEGERLLPTGAKVEMELIRWWVWEVLIHCYQYVICKQGQWLIEIVGSVLLALVPWWVFLIGESIGWKIVHMELTLLYYWAVWARSLYCL